MLPVHWKSFLDREKPCKTVAVNERCSKSLSLNAIAFISQTPTHWWQQWQQWQSKCRLDPTRMITANVLSIRCHDCLPISFCSTFPFIRRQRMQNETDTENCVYTNNYLFIITCHRQLTIHYTAVVYFAAVCFSLSVFFFSILHFFSWVKFRFLFVIRPMLCVCVCVAASA